MILSKVVIILLVHEERVVVQRVPIGELFQAFVLLKGCQIVFSVREKDHLAVAVPREAAGLWVGYGSIALAALRVLLLPRVIARTSVKIDHLRLRRRGTVDGPFVRVRGIAGLHLVIEIELVNLLKQLVATEHRIDQLDDRGH